MTCTRCHGLMLEEHLIDMEAGYGEMWSCTWRCVNCGHQDDAVMRQHRQTHLRQAIAAPQAATVREAEELSWGAELVEPLAA